jgi:hypothetical protein
MGASVPRIDVGVRQRLTARFGSEVEAWLGELPGLLTALAARWRFELGPPIPRGSVSAVFRCRMADGRAAVLKPVRTVRAWPSRRTRSTPGTPFTPQR